MITKEKNIDIGNSTGTKPSFSKYVRFRKKPKVIRKDHGKTKTRYTRNTCKGKTYVLNGKVIVSCFNLNSPKKHMSYL